MSNIPEKRVKTDADLIAFQHSPAYIMICSYLERLCLSVKGVVDPPSSSHGKGVDSVLALLNTIRSQVVQIPPLPQPMRFGNKAFRTFHQWLTENVVTLLRSCIEIADVQIIPELAPYLLDAFGNATRIDYGTGHEAAFLCFLIVLMENGILGPGPQVVLVVFREYVSLVRLITAQYVMEPAGSHGVWGLDDYHHLPFLFGAAQLIGHETHLVKPIEMLNRCKQLEGISMYAECIQFIIKSKCKSAPFHEVAPLLSDVARMDNWSLVCFGLIKLYKTEVLGKRPIVQHIFFGNTIRWS